MNETKMKPKILVVGDPEVGKTSFIHCFLGYSFSKKWKQTEMVTIYSLPNMDIFDIPGKLRDKDNDYHFHRATGAIILYDVMSTESYRNVDEWIFNITKSCGHIPIIVCANKTDRTYRLVHPKRDEVCISVKANFNIHHTVYILNTS